MPKTLLAIGAHADDCEIGVGGLLIQAARKGCRVVIVSVVSDFSTWSATLGREVETKERFLALAKKYGFEKRFLDYPYHVIDGGDVELKRKLARIYLDVQPETAFIHHIEDHYPDHVACGRAGHDACLFAHGLTGDLNAPRISRLFSFTVTPWQTYKFEEDCYYDVSDVMPEYMDMLNEIDSAYLGRPVEECIGHEVVERTRPERAIRLGGHAWTKFADCIQHGSRAGCRHAIGLKTVWGKRSGPELF